MNPLLD
ncbi:hypothetical protein CFP56_012567 [Quercus suber]